MPKPASTNAGSFEYGVIIKPTTYCKAINVIMNMELLLAPGIQYHLPWNKEDLKIINVDIQSTNKTENLQEVKYDQESICWLKIAESSFEFWDNEIDEIWNNV